MSLDELNTEQKIMVKQALLTNRADAEGRDISMSELAEADNLFLTRNYMRNMTECILSPTISLSQPKYHISNNNYMRKANV